MWYPIQGNSGSLTWKVIFSWRGYWMMSYLEPIRYNKCVVVAVKYTHQRSDRDDSGCVLFDAMCDLIYMWFSLNQLFTLEVENQWLPTCGKYICVHVFNKLCLLTKVWCEACQDRIKWIFHNDDEDLSHHKFNLVVITPYLYQNDRWSIVQASHNTLEPHSYIAGTISKNSKNIFLPIGINYADQYIDHVEHHLASIPFKHWQHINAEVFNNK